MTSTSEAPSIVDKMKGGKKVNKTTADSAVGVLHRDWIFQPPSSTVHLPALTVRRTGRCLGCGSRR